ncbi:microtubule-associated protein tau-like [Brassica napus]|nr:microtubule-associated protein tau-like [Brassica napus]
MKELPDLSALIKKKLSEAKKASSATPSETTLSGTTPREETPREETPRVKTPRGAIPPAPLPLVVSPGPSTGPANVDSSREDLTLISERETTEPSLTGGNKKRSAPDSSASAASQARTESDGPPKKKKKKERKKKKSVEEQSEPAEGAENCETIIEKGSSRDAAARGVVDSDNSPSISLKKKKTARSHE